MEAILIFAAISAVNIVGGFAFSEHLPAYEDEPKGQVEVLDEVAVNQPAASEELNKWIKDSDV